MHHVAVCRSIPVLVFSCSIVFAQSSATPGGTGIEGVISISPTHGGPVRADSQGSAPLRETEFVVRKGEETVATFKTDAEGKFSVALPPGHYAISRANWNGRVGRYGPFDVDVSAGTMTKVEWTCDTGMR